MSERRVKVRIADTPLLGSVAVDGQPLAGVISIGIESNPREMDTVVVIRIASQFLEIEHVKDRSKPPPEWRVQPHTVKEEV